MPSASSLVPRRNDRAVAALVSAFESETQGVILRTAPRREHAILYVLVAMFVIALVFIAVTKIDIVVTGTGKTVARAGVIYLQPLDKGVVETIDVHAGDIVRKGQVLATLDPTFAAADLAKLEQKVEATRAEIARIAAEQKDVSYAPAGDGPYERLQKVLYEQRKATYKATLANYDAQIKGAEAQLAQYEADAATYAQRLKVSADLENMQAELEKHGWGSKLKMLTSSDRRLEIQRLLDDATDKVGDTANKIDSLRDQRAAYIDKWKSDLARHMADDRKSVAQIQQDLDKARRVDQMVNVVAPANAYVLKIGKASIGAVVGAGSPQDGAQPLFTLAPLKSPLEVDLKLSPKDIGFVRVGDTVNIKLDAYRFTYYGTAKGKVETISDGSFTLDGNGRPVAPYYKARVALTDIHLRGVPSDFHLVPGMTLTGDILTGRRTILSYITESVMRTGSDAMREP